MDDSLVHLHGASSGGRFLLLNLLDHLRCSRAPFGSLSSSICLCVSTAAKYAAFTTDVSFSFGYIIAACCMAVERKVLSTHYPTNKILRHSFRLKLFFIFAEILLVIICGVAMYEGEWRVSVVAEWIIGLLFTFYMWSCAIDFLTTTDLHENNIKDGELRKHWDEEVGLATPEKALSRTIHKPYVLLP